MLVSDLYPGIQDALQGRVIATAKIAEAVRKTALELSEDFKFSELQVTGPVVQLTARTPNYATSFFMPAPPPTPVKLNKVNSFYLFNDPYVLPTNPSFNGSNAGYELGFKTVDKLEVLINTLGLPTNWTRYNGQIWFGCNPDSSYSIQMRYQQEHPFPNAGLITAGNDTLYFPNSWQDILELASAQRLAENVNLSTKASELNARLRGDQQFQKTSGLSGSPGLIFKRTSDEERDQTTTVKSFRLRMRSVV